MALIVSDIKIPINESEEALRAFTARRLGVDVRAIRRLRVVRVALDARKKNDIRLAYTVLVELSARDEARAMSFAKTGVTAFHSHMRAEPVKGSVRLTAPIVIAGYGPAGIFAAYELAKNGYKPIVIERGMPIDRRNRDVECFFSGGELNEQSNIMFGEGGAGTFSDGKLTTRIKDERADDVIKTLARFGAPEEITVASKPHIGTDVLKATIKNMRAETERLGGRIIFAARLTGINSQDGKIKSISIERSGERQTIECCACILAIGQGARDTYRMLHDIGLELAPKPFAVGVRIEHPQELINKAQYGEHFAHPRLGAAEYSLAEKSGARGVYTFCMCPGGSVVASSSAFGEVVTNGMSNYARDGENANAAIVVAVEPSDWGGDAMGGIEFQERIERAAYRLGGGDYYAPAERTVDFIKREHHPKAFSGVRPTYRPGVRAKNIYDCLPEFVSNGVREGIVGFARRLRGFDMPESVITAPETRTSAPLRICRNELGEATRMKGLYPVGEGAGYAGGIVSAAVDGMRAAERIMAVYASPND